MNRTHARKRRQLQHALKQARRALAQGLRPTHLIARIHRLVAALRGAVPARAWAGLAALGLAAPVAAQNFTAATPNAFGLSGNVQVSDMAFVDLDGDGDLDLIGRGFSYYAYGPVLVYHENTGPATAPQFGPQVENPFGQLTQYEGWDLANFYGGLGMEVADLDGDGDYDLMFPERYGYGYAYTPYNYGYFQNPIIWVENTGTPQSPAFSAPAQIDPYGLSLASLGSAEQVGMHGAECMDVDGDGDLDLVGVATNFDYSMGGGPTHGFFWCENAGSSADPEFLPPAMEPFGLHGPDVPEGASLTFHLDAVDVDLDGDLDLLESVYFEGGATGYLTELHFIENTGTASAPAYAAPVLSPFGMLPSPADGLVLSAFADLDADGDPDLVHTFISDYMNGGTPQFLFQENLGGVNGIDEPAAATLRVFPNPVAQGGQLRIEGGADWTAYALFDARGREVAAGSLIGMAVLAVDAPAGLYSMVCSRPDGTRSAQQVVVR